MLASLLPGLRDLRTPLATGYVWLLNAWLIWGDKVPTSKAEATAGVSRTISSLLNIVPPTAALAAVTFVAYLVGALLQVGSFTLRAPDGSNIDLPGWRFIAPVSRGMYRNRSQIRALVSEVIDELPEAHRQGLVSGIVAGKAASYLVAAELGEPPEPQYDDLERSMLRHESAIQTMSQAVQSDIPQLSTRLHAENKELFDDYDRFRSEAEMRLSLTLPIATLLVILSIRWSPLALAGLIVPAVLVRQGTAKAFRAEDVVYQALSLGIVKSPVLERGERVVSEVRGS